MAVGTLSVLKRFFHYLTRRTAALIPVLLGVSFAAFVLIRLLPGDPITLLLAESERSTPEEIAEAKRRLGLDRPLVVQYAHYLYRLGRGDMGRSIRSGRPIVEEIAARYPSTVLLAVGAIIVTVIVGIPLGIVAAVNKDSMIDRLAMIGALFGISAPIFWLGLVLQIVFALWLGILPSAGKGGILHLLLPVITLGLFPVANVARLVRMSMLEVLGQEYMTAARAKGLPDHLRLFRHALKNALIPAVTIIGLSLGYMLGGAVVTEVVFAWPGVGRYLVQAIFARDYPVVQGVILTIALSYVLINFLTDVVYSFLDPRIRIY
jgi:ABC-type dipeptide/oligopeptide/nickel transport system permease component